VTDTSDDQGLIEVTGGTQTNAAARNKAAKVDITSFAQHFSAIPTTGPGTHQASYIMCTGSLSRGLKQPGRGLDHSNLASRLKKQYSYPSTRPLTLIACSSVQFTSTFTAYARETLGSNRGWWISCAELALHSAKHPPPPNIEYLQQRNLNVTWPSVSRHSHFSVHIHPHTKLKAKQFYEHP
jgi:hypothetical protein